MADVQVKVGNGVGTIPQDSPGYTNLINQGWSVQNGILSPTNPLAPSVTPVTTSDTARDGYQSLYDQLGKMSANPPQTAITYGGQTFNNTTDLLGAQRAGLEARRVAEVARLNSEFDSAEQSQGQAQKSETGTSSMGLARIGGFDSASGQAVLTNLERVHTQEQQALVAKRQAAIQQAQQAYEDKDFALAQLQLDEARKTEQTIYDRQNDFLNNTLKLKDAQRSDLNQQLQLSQFDYQKKRDDRQDSQNALQFALENGIDKPFFVIGGIGYDTSTGDKLSYQDFIDRGGKPDFSNAEVITPGSQADKAFVQNLRNTYPDAGILASDTAEVASQKVANSRIYKKSVYIPPSSSGSVTERVTAGQSKIVNDAAAAFDAAKGEDGYVNPDVYRKFKRDYINAGGTPTDFFQALPVEQYIKDTNRRGDLVGSSIDYQQVKADAANMDDAQKQARIQQLTAKVEDGSASLQELIEFQQLRGK